MFEKTTPGREPFIGVRDASVSIFHATLASSLKQSLLSRGRGHGVPRTTILRDLNFEARPGERIGIVGRNGTGKTTFLKAIAGIYPLDGGTVEVTGTIAAVIAQSVGLEDELSVSDNIKSVLANTGRLALHSPEFERRVLDFAELTDKAREPLRTLSSGFRARLSFALVLFQRADILMLDEVFAVGDAGFVGKAVKAMTERIMTTPIVLLVAHDDALVRRLCNRCVLFSEGRIVADGPTEAVLDRYRALLAEASAG